MTISQHMKDLPRYSVMQTGSDQILQAVATPGRKISQTNLLSQLWGACPWALVERETEPRGYQPIVPHCWQQEVIVQCHKITILEWQ